MKKTVKKIRARWHRDINDTQNENFRDIQNTQNKNYRELQETLVWLLFKTHDILGAVNNKTWFAEYSSYDAYKSDYAIQEHIKKIEVLIANYMPPYIKGYCEVCGEVKVMKADFNSIMDTSESYSCCGMTARMRAMYEYVSAHFGRENKVYLAEAVTPSYFAYENYFGPHNITGSEFLGPDKISGVCYEHEGRQITHQDCANLSFPDNTFDILISQNVLEHIFDIKSALSESFRVLKNNGSCVISIPFFRDSRHSELLAEEKDGRIRQIINPPEIHLNPVGQGSLAFYHHGWEFLGLMEEAGFRDVKARFYNNLYKGYLGVQSLITGKKP